MSSLQEFFNRPEHDHAKGIVQKNNIIKRSIIAYMAVHGECTLAELAREVYTMEINSELHEMAKSNPFLKACSNIHFIHGNGYRGYPPAAPYVAVIVTAAPPLIPQELVNQLAPGGRMVIPVGDYSQELQLITKNADNNVNITPIIGVRFVHMTGEP